MTENELKEYIQESIVELEGRNEPPMGCSCFLSMITAVITFVGFTILFGL